MMRNLWLKIIIISAWLFLPFQSFAQTPDPGPTVSHLVQAYISQQGIPGIAVALYYHNQAYFYNFGVRDISTQQPVTSDTIFEIGSITKTFTATLLAEQILNHRMKLSDPVVNYLPSEVKSKGGAINQVTLEELATHTSGLPRIPPGLTLSERANYKEEDLMNYVTHWQPDSPVGTEYFYSNIGFGLLGYALEGATGKSFTILLQQDILNPLGMASTSIDYAVDPNRYAMGYGKDGQPAVRCPKNAWSSGGAMRSTAKDLLQYLEANLGVQSSKVPPQLLQAMQFAQKPLQKIDGFLQDMAWSTSNGITKKNGTTAGFSAAISLMPSEKMGIVILTNKTKVDPTRLANQILRQLD